jgi:hypothetical protein
MAMSSPVAPRALTAPYPPLGSLDAPTIAQPGLSFDYILSEHYGGTNTSYYFAASSINATVSELTSVGNLAHPCPLYPFMWRSQDAFDETTGQYNLESTPAYEWVDISAVNHNGEDSRIHADVLEFYSQGQVGEGMVSTWDATLPKVVTVFGRNGSTWEVISSTSEQTTAVANLELNDLIHHTHMQSVTRIRIPLLRGSTAYSHFRLAIHAVEPGALHVSIGKLRIWGAMVADVVAGRNIQDVSIVVAPVISGTSDTNVLAPPHRKFLTGNRDSRLTDLESTVTFAAEPLSPETAWVNDAARVPTEALYQPGPMNDTNGLSIDGALFPDSEGDIVTLSTGSSYTSFIYGVGSIFGYGVRMLLFDTDDDGADTWQFGAVPDSTKFGLKIRRMALGSFGGRIGAFIPQWINSAGSNSNRTPIFVQSAPTTRELVERKLNLAGSYIGDFRHEAYDGVNEYARTFSVLVTGKNIGITTENIMINALFLEGYRYQAGAFANLPVLQLTIPRIAGRAFMIGGRFGAIDGATGKRSGRKVTMHGTRW